MKVNSIFSGKNKSPEEISKDKLAKKQKDLKQGWRKAIQDDVDDDGSVLSDISASTDGELGDYIGNADGRSENFKNFEKVLRVKHARACNAMSVRYSNKGLRSRYFCCRDSI